MKEHSQGGQFKMAKSSGALNLLSAYNSSSESEEEIPLSRVSVKRAKPSNQSPENSRKKLAIDHQEKERLPLPSSLLQLFQSKEKVTDHSDEHLNGRVRSFPHERGNWASYVYIAVEPCSSLQSYIDVVCTTCDPLLHLERSVDLHVSLTKTVILRHHWIDSISSSVQKLAQCTSRFSACLGEVRVYTNEEKSRTFIGIVITAGRETLTKITRNLDEILAEFRLPSFYQEASFHMSIASCVGNHAAALNNHLPRLQKTLDMFIHTQPLEWSLNIDKIHFRTGNKFFAFSLLS